MPLAGQSQEQCGQELSRCLPPQNWNLFSEFESVASRWVWLDAVAEIDDAIESYTPRRREKNERDKTISGNEGTSQEPQLVSSPRFAIREAEGSVPFVKPLEQIENRPGIIAVVDGVGFAEIFRLLGADHVVLVGAVIPSIVRELVAAMK